MMEEHRNQQILRDAKISADYRKFVLSLNFLSRKIEPLILR